MEFYSQKRPAGQSPCLRDTPIATGRAFQAATARNAIDCLDLHTYHEMNFDFRGIRGR
jgi:hypothetical protein